MANRQAVVGRRVARRIDRPLLAGVSPAPKHGPQNAVRTIAPACMRSNAAPLLAISKNTGWELGYTESANSPLPQVLPLSTRAACITLVIDRPLLAGVSPAPKHGPQNAVRTIAPACMRSNAAPLLAISKNTGWELGYTESANSPLPQVLPLSTRAACITLVKLPPEQPAMTPCCTSPKHGPQNAVRTIAPACMRSNAAPLLAISKNTGWELGYTECANSPLPQVLPLSTRAASITLVKLPPEQPAMTPCCNCRRPSGRILSSKDSDAWPPPTSAARSSTSCRISSQRRAASAHLGGAELDLVQDILEVGVELLDGVGVRGVERQRDHGAHRGEVDSHAPIVVGDGSGIELAVVRLASVLGKIGARILVRAPNGGEARRLGGHDIHAVAVIGRR